MKKSILFTLSILFCISLNSQRGANAEYWVSFTYLPKKGMVEEFEKAVADKTAKYNATEEDAIFAFQIMTGGGQGAYQRWVVRKDRSFFDQDNAEELKYWNENVDPYIADKSGQKIWQMLKGASHGWDEPRTPVKYYVQNTVVIKRGKNQDFLRVHRRFKQVMSKMEYTGNRGVFKLVSGGNEQTFMIIRGFDSHTETFTTNLPEDGSWRDVYAELFGEEAMAEDMPALNESIEMWGSSVVKMMYRPDLSSKL
ncbi:hypothetical protein OA490_04990 [Flavobacteriales bacterium]|nr:hypothetical protein [Flavobacteriales bacterium]